MTADLNNFLKRVTHWAENHDDIVGLALVGSHARNAAGPDSDVDLCVLCENTALLIQNQEWTVNFGAVQSKEIEYYGATTSLRIYYENGMEVEFGIANHSWARVPLDSGTQRVISDGIRILYDPIKILAKAINAATASLLP